MVSNRSKFSRVPNSGPHYFSRRQGTDQSIDDTQFTGNFTGNFTVTSDDFPRLCPPGCFIGNFTGTLYLINGSLVGEGPAPPPPHCPPLKGGPAAGLATGAAVFGALVAALLAFVWMKRVKKRRSAKHPRPVVDYDRILPQGLDAATLKGDVSRFFTAIETHVENFYHDDSFRDEVASKQVEQSVSIPSGILKQRDINFEELVSNPRNRMSAITCLICADILDCIDPFGNPDRSLLPKVVTSFLRSIPPPKLDILAESLCLSRWRTSSAFLLKLSEKPGAEEKDHRERALANLLRHLNDWIAPFEIPEKSEVRVKDLESLCIRGGRLGATLFSQPAMWEFLWNFEEPPQSRSSRQRVPLVIFSRTPSGDR